MEGLFSLGLLVLVVVAVGAAVYGTQRRRRGGEEPRERLAVTSSGIASDGSTVSSTEVSAPPGSSREYFESMGLETGEEMKMHLYSLDEYEGARRRRPRRPFGPLYRRPQGQPADRGRVRYDYPEPGTRRAPLQAALKRPAQIP